jgi:hypothetical protein
MVLFFPPPAPRHGWNAPVFGPRDDQWYYDPASVLIHRLED